jgi:hypothetical protein
VYSDVTSNHCTTSTCKGFPLTCNNKIIYSVKKTGIQQIK